MIEKVTPDGTKYNVYAKYVSIMRSDGVVFACHFPALPGFVANVAYSTPNGIVFKTEKELVEITRDGSLYRLHIGDAQIYASDPQEYGVLIQYLDGQFSLLTRDDGGWHYDGLTEEVG